MEQKVKQILSEAVQAPSGDNCQPWEFKLTPGGCQVFNVSGKDNQIFNYQNRGSLIAHGALLENISIVASHYGLQAEISLVLEGDLIAEIKFSEAFSPSPLYEAVANRATNRKMYADKTIPSEVLEELANSKQDLGLRFFSDKEELKLLGRAASTTEEVMLSNQTLHDAFFDFVRWSKASETKSGFGMYIKTLELAPPQEVVFKLFSKWSRAKVMSALGLAKFVADQNGALYSKSSAMGLFSITDLSARSFIALGRSLEQLWLKATIAGLAIQPITAILFLGQRLDDGQAENFDQVQKQKIQKAVSTIKHLATDQGRPVFLFRIGFADPPTARSTKLAPVYRI